MRKYRVLIAVAFAVVAISACSTVPITGRRQLMLVSDKEMLSMSFQQYAAFLKQNNLSANARQTQMVVRVGTRIEHAVERYFSAHGLADKLDGYQWEFHLVESKEANAWAMPGGKVVVYAGILPLCQNDTGLAVVLGHEVAHAVADHGAERMSHALLAELGGAALKTAIKNKPEKTRTLWMGAFGAGASYGALLPFSRTQESEADHLGLIFMSMAGYDPRAATAFWERMEKMGGGKAPPEFMSTHPSDQRRIADIRRHLPEALTYYTAGR